MATIYEVSKNTARWNAQVQWPNGMNQDLLQEAAMQIQDKLQQEEYDVEYYHAESGGAEKLTNYTITDSSGMTFPERMSDNWTKAVAEINGAKSIYLELDKKVGSGN